MGWQNEKILQKNGVSGRFLNCMTVIMYSITYIYKLCKIID